MRYLYLILICTFLISCKKEKSSCLSYDEAVAQGRIEKKTSDLKINDSLTYTLHHVLDKEATKGPYCFGLLELQQDEFNKAADFLKGYDYAKVVEILLYFEGTDLCQKEIPEIKDVKAYMVYYADKENYLTADYINPAMGIKESSRVSDIWGSVGLHYLFASGIKNKHAAISIRNTTFDIPKTKMVKKNEDLLYRKVHPDKIFLW